MTVRRVLLVDDEDDIREVASVSLRVFGGFEVHAAASGADALAQAEQAPPDGIVLDVMMPGMDGPATLDALRSNPATANIPVVFLTAKAQASDRARFEALGAAGIVTKPFDPTTLADQIKAAFGWSS